MPPAKKKKSPVQPSGKTAVPNCGVDNGALDPKMLQLLVCPLTKHSLELDRERGEIKSTSARLAYPIRGGIPILLPSEARPLEDSEL